jgi:hypothetical protein
MLLKNSSFEVAQLQISHLQREREVLVGLIPDWKCLFRFWAFI